MFHGNIHHIFTIYSPYMLFVVPDVPAARVTVDLHQMLHGLIEEHQLHGLEAQKSRKVQRNNNDNDNDNSSSSSNNNKTNIYNIYIYILYNIDI